MANSNIVVLGAKGMLGTDLMRTLRQKKIPATALDLPEFDITDKEQLKQALENAAVIINCAAYTNVEKAESQTDLAYKVNADAVANLAAIAENTGAWLLHISTDFVFDGRGDTPYVETDIPNPINAYGKTKLAGEQLLLESNCENCIMRLEWTYGLAGNNFVKKLIAVAEKNKNLRVVDDQVGSPTAATEAAKVICKLINKKPQGLFHFAAAGYVSRYEMARFVFDKLDMNVNLTPCKTSDYETAAQRPLNSRLNCDKIGALLGEEIEHWQKPLENFLRRL